jgi:hypothetical protein
MNLPPSVYLLIGVLLLIVLALGALLWTARNQISDLQATLVTRRAEMTVIKNGAAAAGRLLGVITKSGHIVSKREALAMAECRAMLVDMCKLDDDGV